jgi:hypothetical protein
MSRALIALASAALLAAPALAAGYGFSAEYAQGAAVPTIGTLEIAVNPEMVRAPRAIQTRAPNGHDYIAPRDAEDLVDELRDALEDSLSRTGAYAPMAARPVGTLRVTIETADPSNPAHTRAGMARNLDFRSAGRGGATLSAELISPTGDKVADYTYRWEESTFDVTETPRIGWWGAERAFDRFADRLARDLDEHSMMMQPAS